VENLNPAATVENLNPAATVENLNPAATVEKLNPAATVENLNPAATVENLNTKIETVVKDSTMKKNRRLNLPNHSNNSQHATHLQVDETTIMFTQHVVFAQPYEHVNTEQEEDADEWQDDQDGIRRSRGRKHRPTER
jgi:hypothetical protein